MGRSHAEGLADDVMNGPSIGVAEDVSDLLVAMAGGDELNGPGPSTVGQDAVVVPALDSGEIIDWECGGGCHGVSLVGSMVTRGEA